MRFQSPCLLSLSASVCSALASCSMVYGKLYKGDCKGVKVVAYVFNSALGAFRAFGDWFTSSDEWMDVVGIGVVLGSLAFICALTHKNTL